MTPWILRLLVAIIPALPCVSQTIIAWGYNHAGQTNVPSLPAGLHYTALTVNSFSSHNGALLSDGSATFWGFNSHGQAVIPSLPPGRSVIDPVPGGYHSVARLDDGSVIAWGRDIAGETIVPPLAAPAMQVGAGSDYTAALLADGSIVAWGAFPNNQASVLPLPPGLTYVELSTGTTHTLARRSDGSVVAWGDNALGQTNVPTLPAGLSYVEINGGQLFSLARRSDGSVVAWGDNTSGQLNVPALPAGLTYVEMAAGAFHAMARRSDGSVVAWGLNTEGQTVVPPLAANQSYRDIEAGWRHSVARTGPTSSYVTFAAGCAGSAPAARLVPLDTPRLDSTLEVRLFDLPFDAAIMITSFDDTTSPFGPLPLDLSVLGMTGCTAYVNVESTTPLIGANQQVVYSLPIPNAAGLVGLSLYQQALVLDYAAGNSLNMVMSDAATMVIGSF